MTNESQNPQSSIEELIEDLHASRRNYVKSLIRLMHAQMFVCGCATFVGCMLAYNLLTDGVSVRTFVFVGCLAVQITLLICNEMVLRKEMMR